MCKVFAGHQIVCLDRALNVVTVDSDRHTHDHVLWTFCDLAIEAEEVRSLEGLESEVLVVEVSVVDNGRVELGLMLHDAVVCFFADHRRQLAISRVDVVVEILDHGGELLLCLLVEIGDCDTSSEDGIVGVGDCHVCSGLCGLGGVSRCFERDWTRLNVLQIY